MGVRRSIVAGLLLLLASPLPSEAGTTPTEGSAEPVRVYTNADLERFGPVRETSVPAPDPAVWQQVNEFLERAYRRLDADRAHELERRRVEAETEALPRRHDRLHLPLAPYHVRPVQRPYRLSPVGRPDSSLDRWIVPLHARPTQAQLHRARAMRHSGADAVPQR